MRVSKETRNTTINRLHNFFTRIFLKVWTEVVVATVPTSRRPAAASATQDGKARTAPSPPALTSATTTADVWTGSVCAIRATRETTAARWRVRTTATTRGSVWMGNVCASRTSPARTATSRSVLMTALVMAGAWTGCASVMKAFTERTAHQVRQSNSHFGKEQICTVIWSIYLSVYLSMWREKRFKLLWF